MLTTHLAALTFHDNDRALTRVEIAVTLALHLAGLVAAAYLLQVPIWLAPVVLFLLSIIPVLVYRKRGTFVAQSLAPFFFLYAIIAARFIFIRTFGGDVPGYFDYNLPDLRSSLFRLEPWFACALLYTLAIQARSVILSKAKNPVVTGKTSFFGAKTALQNGIRFFAPLALTLVAFAWATTLYIGQRTHGVTGTDPYAYAQMGIDLALSGTPLHRFELFKGVAPLNISWSPIVHIGYHVPINSSGDAPTVWPIGGSFAFAVAYRLLGEPGLYLVNPLASLLLLIATGWLAWELFSPLSFRGAERREIPNDTKICRFARNDTNHLWIVALSIAMLATSHTLFDWATVPMVDAQAALFSVLAIGLARQFARQPRLVFAVLCGVTLGAAYFVRHTQVLIVPAICVLLWLNDAPRRLRARAILAAGLTSFLVALPDLWYHQAVFGSWLTPESRELDVFSLAAIGTTTITFVAELIAAREFGWLLPFLLYGAYRLARTRRAEFAAVALWVIVLIGFHLLYPALRLRDLLPEFPPLVLIAAYGVVALVGATWMPPVISSEARNPEATATRFLGAKITPRNDMISRARALVAASVLIATLFVLLMRVWNVLPIPFGAPQYSYGYMTTAQRASFDRIAALAPSNSVIGAMLNDGAIDLYAQRATFRPSEWNSAERVVFVDAMLRANRRVFLLDDSAALSQVRRDFTTRYTLKQIIILDVPLSGLVDGTPGALWEVSRVVE